MAACATRTGGPPRSSSRSRFLTCRQGGQWNHIAHDLGLHFQGFAIRVVRCGNVEGIPSGSRSPRRGVGQLWLAAPSPNPIQESATFGFGLPRDAGVTLRVYDVAGRMVSDVVADVLPAGSHTVRWDRLDDAGNRVSRGIYFVRLTFEDQVLSRTITVR